MQTLSSETHSPSSCPPLFLSIYTTFNFSFSYLVTVPCRDTWTAASVLMVLSVWGSGCWEFSLQDNDFPVQRFENWQHISSSLWFYFFLAPCLESILKNVYRWYSCKIEGESWLNHSSCWKPLLPKHFLAEKYLFKKEKKKLPLREVSDLGCC